MTSLLTASLLSLVLLAPLTAHAQSRSYLRTPPDPELYNWYSMVSPSPGTVVTITVASQNAPQGTSVTVSPVDSNGNVTITSSDGLSVSVPAEMMDDRSIGSIVDAANQTIALGGYDSTMVSESDYSSADADYGGSGSQDSTGAEYE